MYEYAYDLGAAAYAAYCKELKNHHHYPPEWTALEPYERDAWAAAAAKARYADRGPSARAKRATDGRP